MRMSNGEVRHLLSALRAHLLHYLNPIDASDMTLVTTNMILDGHSLSTEMSLLRGWNAKLKTSPVCHSQKI